MFRLIGEKDYEKTMRETVEPALAALREEIELPLETGGTLHVERYDQAKDRGVVVVLHGYTESGEKFREMAWYFVQAGYSVVIPDHRGHGRSVRAVEDLSVTHVDRFDDYLNDLKQVMDQIVLPRWGGGTRLLYAHSMGGAIGALALIRHPAWFHRAMLTAPMIAPVTAPLPAPLARALAGFMCRLGKGKTRAFIGKPFDAESETFEASFSTSRARFDYYEKKRIATPQLQNCSPTYGWVREAASVTRTLLAPENTARIQTPLLLCQAGRDTIVRLPEQDRFVEQVAGATKRVFETARHEIYASCDAVMESYVPAVLGFLAGEAEASGALRAK